MIGVLPVPQSLLRRDKPPSEEELAAEVAMLHSVVLIFILKRVHPGEFPDEKLRSMILDYLCYATGHTKAYYRGKYFALSDLYSRVLKQVQYSGKWSRPGRKQNRVRSASAVSRGTSGEPNPWRRVPKHLLLPKDGGKLDGDSLSLDPFELLGIVSNAISDLYLLQLNNGAFF